MSGSPSSCILERPNLVSLVVQSKKALQHGEALCHRANTLENASAQTALDVLALNAKVKWISDAVLEQLKVCYFRSPKCVKGIMTGLFVSLLLVWRRALKRSGPSSRSRHRCVRHQFSAHNLLLTFLVYEAWDALRTERTNILDGILDSLGSQPVPPDFHEDTSDSSLFGSPQSDSNDEHGKESASPHNSPSLTIRYPHVNGSNGRLGPDKGKGVVHGKGKGKERADRSRWKTLRDFVDERAVDEALETMEAERTSLDVRFVPVLLALSSPDIESSVVGCIREDG